MLLGQSINSNELLLALALTAPDLDEATRLNLLAHLLTQDPKQQYDLRQIRMAVELFKNALGTGTNGKPNGNGA